MSIILNTAHHIIPMNSQVHSSGRRVFYYAQGSLFSVCSPSDALHIQETNRFLPSSLTTPVQVGSYHHSVSKTRCRNPALLWRRQHISCPWSSSRRGAPLTVLRTKQALLFSSSTVTLSSSLLHNKWPQTQGLN